MATASGSVESRTDQPGLLEGHAVLPADGAEPGADRDGVLAGHLSWFPSLVRLSTDTQCAQ